MFSTDPRESAAEAGLCYVSGRGPCIRRVRHGKSFRYVAADGRPVRDPKQLERIRSLAIPPAWSNVWICPSANGHLQAYGWDAKGRKQYRYHPLYRSARDEAKFSRMIAFGTVLSVIRRGWAPRPVSAVPASQICARPGTTFVLPGSPTKLLRQRRDVSHHL
jgi:DNA topoisomerase I